MCRTNRRSERAEGYQGPTINLAAGDLAVARSSQRCTSSPWHLLWLIWPVSLLFKWLAPTLVLLWTSFATDILPFLFNMQTALALLLIGAGLALIVRRDRVDEHPYD